MTNKELFKETDNPFFLSNKTERDKEDKNECNSPKKLKLSSPIPTHKENFKETLDEVLIRRKKEAVDEYTLYKTTNQIDHLTDALEKDNTNSYLVTMH